MTRMTTKMYYNYYVPWQIKHSFHSCVGCGEELRTRLQRMIKQRCNRELNTLLSCGCLISGVSHRRHRNRVNANETWWKASPRVAQPVRTSSDYCTINHPSVNASAFIIRSPIRHPNLCSPSHKLQIRKRTQESVMRHTIHSDSQRSKGVRAVERKCFVGSSSMSILRYPWGAQIYSIKLGLLRGQSDCFNAE